MINAIIFDLDGVLCHTDGFHYLAWKKIFDSEGIPFNEKDNDLLRGVSRRASLERILTLNGVEMSEEKKEELLVKKNDIYRSYLDSMTSADLDDEVRETLKKLKGKVKLAVGSSSKNTQLILEKLGLTGFFDAVADGSMIVHSKPDPEVFLLAASMLGEDSHNCIVVEDAESGIDAAVAGGFIPVGIGPASHYGKARIHIDSFSEISSIKSFLNQD